VRRLTRSKTCTRPLRTTVTVREQPSSVTQSVPTAAAMLCLPFTLHRPRRRSVATRSRASGGKAFGLRLLPAQLGRRTVSVVVTRRPEDWPTVTAVPDTSADAVRPCPGVALTRIAHSLASSVGAVRCREPLASRTE
jgi:hypothetical protein